MSASFFFRFLIPAAIVFQQLHAQDATKLPGYFKDLFEAQTDSAKVEAYRDLCFNYSLLNPDSGIYFGKKGLELALKINFIKGIGDCYNSLGWCYSKKGSYKEADENLKLAKKYFERTGNKCYVSVAVANIGNMNFLQSRMAEALENYLLSEKLNEGCPDEGFKSSGLYSIGTIYNSQKEYDKAIVWFKKANEINIANKDTGKLAECINGTGNAFLGLKMYDSALVYFERAIFLFNAVRNLNGVAFSNESIGTLFLEQKNFTRALAHFEIALEKFREIKSTPDVCYELMVIGDAYQQKGEINSAIIYQQLALQLADSNRFASMQQQALSSLSGLYALKKDYRSAYEYFQKSVAIKDSIGLQQQQAKLDELKTKFEAEEKDRQIELLNKDKQIEQAKAEKQRQLKNVFIAGVIMLLLVAVVLFNRYQLKRKAANELTQKNEIIRKEKERAEQSEKFKQQFLANMSHEIRTPMNAIMGMTELLQDAELNTQQKKYLDVIKNSSDNLLAIINDILELSKLEAGKMELEKTSFNLKELIDNLFHSFEYKTKAKGIELLFEIDDSVPGWVISDPLRLNQVLINLMSNAVKFTERGGVRLHVSSELNTEDQHVLVFKVSDTGIGIPAHLYRKIFDSFTQSSSGTTRKYGGTGLGLTISKNLVEVFGGTIKVKSEEGVGSEFTFIVPAEPATATEVNEESFIIQSPEPGGRIYKILLAEDNEYNQLLVIDALKKKLPSAIVTVAANGMEAKEILQSEEFDLLLLDIQMPGMDGYELARIIRNDPDPNLCKMPIIAITANVGDNEQEKCMEAGMNDFISKPFRIRELTGKINTHLGNNFLVNDSEKSAEGFYKERGSITDLSYLYNFTEGDEEEIQKYISLFLEHIPGKLKAAEDAIKSKDSTSVINILHSIKPLVSSLGIAEGEKIIGELEKHKDEITGNKLLPKYLMVRKYCRAAMEELKNNVRV